MANYLLLLLYFMFFVNETKWLGELLWGVKHYMQVKGSLFPGDHCNLLWSDYKYTARLNGRICWDKKSNVKLQN